MEMRFRFFLTLGQDFHLVELFLTAVGHAARRNACLVALDKILLLFDFCLLALISGFFLTTLQDGHFLEFLVAARVARELQVVDVPNDIRHGIEEGHIVRNDDKSIFVVDEIILEPLDMLGVKVVCRLVKQQNLRILQQQFC